MEAQTRNVQIIIYIGAIFFVFPMQYFGISAIYYIESFQIITEYQIVFF